MEGKSEPLRWETMACWISEGTRSKRLGLSPLSTSSVESDHSTVYDTKLPIHLCSVVSVAVGHYHSLSKAVAIIIVKLESSVGKATGYELDGVGVGVRVSVG